MIFSKHHTKHEFTLKTFNGFTNELFGNNTGLE